MIDDEKETPQRIKGLELGGLGKGYASRNRVLNQLKVIKDAKKRVRRAGRS